MEQSLIGSASTRERERERELGSREVVHVLYGGPKRIGGESEVVRGSSWATRFGHVIVGFRHVSL